MEVVDAKNPDVLTSLDRDKWGQIKDTYVQASLKLVEAFGLRREEAIKFMPAYADQGQLKASWCKGSRERTVPVNTPAQRAFSTGCTA
jgi:site-specific recombinase XerD